MNPTPIFVIVKDRITCLKKSVQSWLWLIKDPVQIVFIDNGSTYPPTLDFLKKAQDSGKIDVIWNKAGIDPKTLVTNVSRFWIGWPDIIQQYIDQMPKRPSHYVLSDPDIMFENINGDILRFYAYLLEHTGAVCVGPALELKDIPDYYPLKIFVLKHESEFWKPPIEIIEYKDQKVAYKKTRIDTTFALYRSDHLFKRHTVNAIRVFAPYSAKHLDWYLDPMSMPEDQIYYLNTCHQHGGLSHWGGTQLLKKIVLER